jgi:hypothetical protein
MRGTEGSSETPATTYQQTRRHKREGCNYKNNLNDRSSFRICFEYSFCKYRKSRVLCGLLYTFQIKYGTSTLDRVRLLPFYYLIIICHLTICGLSCWQQHCHMTNKIFQTIHCMKLERKRKYRGSRHLQRNNSRKSPAELLETLSGVNILTKWRNFLTNTDFVVLTVAARAIMQLVQNTTFGRRPL